MTLIERVQQPTPKFFQKIRNAGMLAAAIGASILALPLPLPALLLKIAGYLAIAGGVAGAVSQATTTSADAVKDPHP